MFLGEYTYSIDEKKRLAIPAKFRLALGKKAVITRGLDNCLFVYSWKEWETALGGNCNSGSRPKRAAYGPGLNKLC